MLGRGVQQVGGCIEYGAQESYRRGRHQLMESQEWTRRLLGACVLGEEV